MSLGQDCADPAKIYRVESVIAHNMYSSSIPQHDIALLRLDQEVTFTGTSSHSFLYISGVHV